MGSNPTAATSHDDVPTYEGLTRTTWPVLSVKVALVGGEITEDMLRGLKWNPRP